MSVSDTRVQLSRWAGYLELIFRFDLQVIPNWHQSKISESYHHLVETSDGVTVETYPFRFWPGETVGDHLEFAIKYDGINLAILNRIFEAVPQDEITSYVRSKPRGKYARRIWYLYEFLTGLLLPVDDLKSGAYIDLLDPEHYITANQSTPSKRQKIKDNLLGVPGFCPIIRRTELLESFESKDLTQQCKEIVSDYPTELLKRALSFLYTKETKSSFEIEHIQPNSSRTERFVTQLQLAEKEDFCEKARLIDLQNRIVDHRFRDADYRSVQNYVGETIAWDREKVHFVCPKPEDIHHLMNALVEAHKRMDIGGVSPVVHAATIAYGFVFLHPFEDGNGRIHRFLIHNILARKHFTPEGVMFPVSAVMLKNPGQYNDSLEAFSKPLMPLVEYDLDDVGRMTVENDTRCWYSYMDMTPQAESLYRFIEMTIDTELTKELSFLARYDETRLSIQEIVDMPDRNIDLFIKFCLQNNGRLSTRKRESFFDMLNNDEIAAMEKVVQSAYGDTEGKL